MILGEGFGRPFKGLDRGSSLVELTLLLSVFIAVVFVPAFVLVGRWQGDDVDETLLAFDTHAGDKFDVGALTSEGLRSLIAPVPDPDNPPTVIRTVLEKLAQDLDTASRQPTGSFCVAVMAGSKETPASGPVTALRSNGSACLADVSPAVNTTFNNGLIDWSGTQANVAAVHSGSGAFVLYGVNYATSQ